MKNIKTYEEYDSRIHNFFDNLSETLNNPFDVKYSVEDNVIYGSFNDGLIDYLIVAEIILDGFIVFKFKAKDDGINYTTELNNKRGVEKYRVLATVKQSLYYFLDEVKPRGIIFGALDKSRGRKKVYDRFIDEYLSKNTNVDCLRKEENNEKLYLIHDKDEDIETIISVIKYAVDNNLSRNEL